MQHNLGIDFTTNLSRGFAPVRRVDSLAIFSQHL